MRSFELRPSRVMELVPRVALCLALVSSIVGTSLPVAAAAAGGVGSTARVSTDSNGAEGNHRSGSQSISADGRYVAFESIASNLVPGDTNGTSDVFVKDTATGMTRRVSTDSNGAEGNGDSWNPTISGNPSISADGRYVAFGS